MQNSSLIGKSSFLVCAVLFLIVGVQRCSDSGTRRNQKNKGSSEPTSNTSGEEKNSDEVISASEVAKQEGSFLVALSLASANDLPTCDDVLKGKIYLTTSDMNLHYCQNGEWMTVVTKGAKGDQGLPGTDATSGNQTIDYDFVESSQSTHGMKTKYYKGGLNGKLLRTCYSSSSNSSIYSGSDLAGSSFIVVSLTQRHLAFSLASPLMSLKIILNTITMNRQNFL